VLNHLPSFNNLLKDKLRFTTTYFDTPKAFLSQMGVIVSLTEYNDKNVVTLEYQTQLVDEQKANKVYELELETKEDILARKSLLFIEDRLRVIFGTKLQIDMLHMLKELVPEYKIIVDRRVYEIDHNTGFTAKAYMDDVEYVNVKKRIRYDDKIFEIFMITSSTAFNKGLFDRIIKYIKEKVVLVDMRETRLEATKLFTRFKK
jgi:hypothetical protein